MGRWNLSLPLKVALPCLVLGVVFFLVSFGVNFWVSLSQGDADVKGGLWKVCAHRDGYTVCAGWSDDRFKAIERDFMHKNQALQCLALVLVLGAVGALVVFFLTRLKAAIVTAIATCFMAAFFMILGCVLFATDINNDPLYSAYGKLDWAFGFSIVGAVFMTATGGATILYVLLSTTTTSTSTPNSNTLA